MVEYTMTIKEGKRPRVYFSDFFVGDEGFERHLYVHKTTQITEGKEFPYTDNQTVRVKCIFSQLSFEVRIDGGETGCYEAASARPLSLKLQISSGVDWWSKGKVIFSKFLVSPAPGQ